MLFKNCILKMKNISTILFFYTMIDCKKVKYKLSHDILDSKILCM